MINIAYTDIPGTFKCRQIKENVLGTEQCNVTFNQAASVILKRRLKTCSFMVAESLQNYTKAYTYTADLKIFTIKRSHIWSRTRTGISLCAGIHSPLGLRLNTK